jgi:biopolymer transport protein ExbD
MKPMSSMNVIPFIDVMLVLLAIVLTTATFVAQGRIPVNLPAAKSADPLTPARSVEISIAQDGTVFVDGKAEGDEELSRIVATLGRQTRIRLKVDEDVAFRHFVGVIDLLKEARLRDVAIITRNPAP